jgi:HD-GYP domain-containing protein (c-di-GMP phosphodiesterase class II)
LLNKFYYKFNINNINLFYLFKFINHNVLIIKMQLKIEKVNKLTKKLVEEKRTDLLENALNQINNLLPHIDNEDSLYEKSCEIILNIKDYNLIQINIDNNENGTSSIFATKSNDIFNFLINDETVVLNEGKINIIKVSEIDHTCSKNIFKEFNSVFEFPVKYRRKYLGFVKIYSYMKNAFNNEDARYLKEITDIISIELSTLRFEQKLKEKYLQLKNILYGFMDALVVLSDKRDPYTGAHQRRVALVSSKIAKELNLDEERIEGLYVTSLLHDIGKICVPLSLLSKPGKLSEHEFGVIRGHCLEAYDILKNIDFPWPVAQIILQHHEREDGSGYPNGLENGQILLEAKILAVADVLEAMSAHRPYRSAPGFKKAIQEVKDNKEKLYDKKVVKACLKLYNEKRLDFLKDD